MNSVDTTEFSYELLDFNLCTFTKVFRDTVKIYSLKDYRKYAGDVALYYLFMANFEKIEENLPFDKHNLTAIHQYFRQFDVTGNEQTDIAMWTLISSSELFWDVLKTLADGKNYSEEF